MPESIEQIRMKKLEVSNDKVIFKDVTLEDIELNYFGKIIKINKVEIDEFELDKNNL